MNQVPADDEELLAQLASALSQSDPVPERVLDGARAAFTWRTIDAELASLVFDSTQDLAGVRSAAIDTHERQLTFRTVDGEHEIEVLLIDDDRGRGRRLVGQIIPPAERTVRLTTQDVQSVVRTASLGRFTFDDVPAAPVRLEVLDDDDESELATEWMVL